MQSACWCSETLPGFRQIERFSNIDAVEGDVEKMAVCHCCRYRSLTAHGECNICPVCFWEDDGIQDLGKVSASNHMTLREARLNFKKFGAVSGVARQHVVPDGDMRYAAEETRADDV